MSRKWKPGDVAMVTARWIRTDAHSARYAVRKQGCWRSRAGVEVLDHEVSGARPLVVIDPEDAEQVERLAEAWDGLTHTDLDNSQPMTMRALRMRAALREFADPKPPKPDEPTGLGAVVEDDKGCRWVRVWSQHISGRVWTQGLEVDGRGVARHYDEIDAVRVLSEGVTP